MTVDQSLTLPVASSHDTRRFISMVLRPQRLSVALTLGVVVIGAVAGLLGPALLGQIVDEISDGSSWSISTLVSLLVGVAIVQAIAVGGGGALISRLGATTLADTRERAVSNVLRLPSGVVEQAGSGDIVSRVTGDVDVVASTVNEILPEVTAALVTISTTIVGLFFLDWRFAVAGALATPIQLHTLRWYLRTSAPIYTAERRAEATRSQALLDTIGGVETVHAFGLGARQVGEVTATSRAAFDISMGATRLRARFFGRLNLAEVVGLGAILVVGFKLVGSGSATVGQCTAAALYFHRLFDPINVVLFCVDALQSAYAGLARLVGVATMPVPQQAVRHAAGEHRAVELEQVGYRYGDRGFALTGIDLVVPEGATVALVGASGAGKTTLAKIIAGTLEPTEGIARVSGSLAMVTQEIHVFTGSLGDDVRLARSDASADEVLAALDTVGALGWVRALPDGIDTVVGEGGHALDGMQAQQLALARVVLADPRVVVLDEATAEAASAGAAVLERAARAVLRGRSALVVAHRLSQAVTADLIVVMDDGRIVERGTHEQLVARGGRYTALWGAWSRVEA